MEVRRSKNQTSARPGIPSLKAAIMKNTGVNTCSIRQLNKGLLLDAIKGEEGVNISDLTMKTRLSVSTCSNILRGLIETGEVIVSEDKVARGGRPARVYRYNPSHFCIVCILIKGDAETLTLSYSVVDAAGQAIEKGSKAIKDMNVSHLDKLLTVLKQKHPLTTAAIAVPGVIEGGTVWESEVEGLVGVEIVQYLEAGHNLRVIADNDINFSAIAYGRSQDDAAAASLAFFVFPSNQCPGCSLIINNALVKGKSNYAGEIASIMPLLAASTPNDKRLDESVEALAGTFAAVIITIINPNVIVIAGDRVRPDMLRAIEETCLTIIPNRHMPEIIVKPDFESECFKGMKAMALNGGSSKNKLFKTCAM